MAGKYLCINLHLIWSTKRRRRLISREWRERLYAILGSIARANKARLLAAGSQDDHIHLYISMPSTICLADLINALKANSSRWVHETFSNRKHFAWQEGYAAFSVSKSAEKNVTEYIRNQDEHHTRISFQDELLEFLKKHEIEFDIRYVFD